MIHVMLSLVHIWPTITCAIEPLSWIWSESSVWILMSAAISAKDKWPHFSADTLYVQINSAYIA